MLRKVRKMLSLILGRLKKRKHVDDPLVGRIFMLHGRACVKLTWCRRLKHHHSADEFGCVLWDRETQQWDYFHRPEQRMCRMSVEASYTREVVGLEKLILFGES